jgi:hypothetical protein
MSILDLKKISELTHKSDDHFYMIHGIGFTDQFGNLLNKAFFNGSSGETTLPYSIASNFDGDEITERKMIRIALIVDNVDVITSEKVSK